ncbi:hypothetical protein BJ741DRAFT_714452 [Chytriomyces cf. hyalinus JEL632]|nr:hypothetical protein BJ741DRAFT_714452 [Chytriomyces cf. hyalinus JEL632]
MEIRNKACRTLLRLIRNDTTHADVDLVFEGGAVLTAHAVVLASTSEYYKEALSAKWTANAFGSLEVADKKRPKSNTRKITTNVSVETDNIVLDFLYLGDVEVPPSLASNVIVFANEIMVFSPVQICGDIVAKEENLFVENALAFYFLCDRMHAISDRKSIGLRKLLQNLPLSLESGGMC